MVSGGAETEGGYGKSSLGIGGLGFRRLVPLGALVKLLYISYSRTRKESVQSPLTTRIAFFKILEAS